MSTARCLTIQLNQAFGAAVLWSLTALLLLIEMAWGPSVRLAHWPVVCAVAASTVTITYAITRCTRTALEVITWEHKCTRATVESPSTDDVVRQIR